eukprot:1554729-Heterocapsa_arctica.AAC.1
MRFTGTFAANLLVRVNKLGLSPRAQGGEHECVVRSCNCVLSLAIEAYPSTSTDSAFPSTPTLIDGAVGRAMNVYDDEENVNFEMAPPLEGEEALPPVPDQPAAADAAERADDDVVPRPALQRE